MSDQELVALEPQANELQGWEGAAQRGLLARQERETIIARVLKPGLDYGIIPGTKKPTLFKPGAEKIMDSLNLYADYETISSHESWDVTKPMFAYRYRCILRQRGTGMVICTGIGSCNSFESRYYWRNNERMCPECGMPAIIKGKEEYGGGWLCFKKKAGCGKKFMDGDQSIESQSVGKTVNDDIFSLVNTVDKMGQKRSKVAAVLDLGFSEQFTQDMEDIAATVMAHLDEEVPPPGEPDDAPEAAKPIPTWQGTIMRVEPREGKTNGKPWTLFTITADDGTTFGTFDKKIAERLSNAVAIGGVATVAYEVTKKGGKDVKAVEVALPFEDVKA